MTGEVRARTEWFPLAVEVDPSDGAGIRSISLADSDVELVSGTVYQWFIAVPEPDDDGFVVVSGGSILTFNPMRATPISSRASAVSGIVAAAVIRDRTPVRLSVTRGG